MQTNATSRSVRVSLALDLVERAAVATLFGYLLWNILVTWYATGNPVSLVLLASEGCAVIFILTRRLARDTSMNVSDWLVAVLGTTAPLLIRPVETVALAPPSICLSLMLMGFVLQIAAKLTLRRSFGIVPANRGVKIGGPYRFIRHPMYAGYVLTQIGFLLTYPTFWNASIYLVAFAFQIGRIRAEERLLSRDAAYRDFAAAVPYRLAPGIF